MITRAIIEEKINNYQYRVRIPIYHKIQGADFATKLENLPIAEVCQTAGISPEFNVGQIVYVSFQEDHVSFPVIIGQLFAPNAMQSACNINCDSLVVNVDSNLSSDTIIGNVDSQALQNVAGLQDSAQEQLDFISAKISLQPAQIRASVVINQDYQNKFIALNPSSQNIQITIPTNQMQQINIGTVFTFVLNSIANSVTISPAAGISLRWKSGSGEKQLQTLYGVSYLYKWSDTIWFLYGDL